MHSSDNTYLSVGQLAERFACSVDSIYRWKREGDFPKGIKLGPGTTRWLLRDIEDWESSRPTCLITHIDLDDRYFPSKE
ncbi:helix-turn-helix transcriptional regulator [Yoonia sp.]|uniref:helix-turn-helix transcriptional regulator n=1 Tax=Yoonia sp. TaxID=2212373 RepID=UPI003F6C8CBC